MSIMDEIKKDIAKTYEYKCGYQQCRIDIIAELRKLDEENYCPYKGDDCCYMYSDLSCISCYLDKIEGKEQTDGIDSTN